MKTLIITLMTILVSLPALATEPTANEILEKVDQNMTVEQAVRVTKIIIHGRRGSRTIESRSWIRGADQALVEYLSPAREKGKKMLKLGDKLWTYTPEPNDRIITISGHLLRQSVMGSDLSYEDLTENSRLQDVYDAVTEGSEQIDDRTCWVLMLTAKERDVAYHSRKLWVDAERWVPLKEERYAKSGKLLKTFAITEVFQVDGRWYAKRMQFKDMLSKGKGTEWVVESIDFDVDIPKHRLTLAALRR